MYFGCRRLRALQVLLRRRRRLRRISQTLGGRDARSGPRTAYPHSARPFRRLCGDAGPRSAGQGESRHLDSALLWLASDVDGQHLKVGRLDDADRTILRTWSLDATVMGATY